MAGESVILLDSRDVPTRLEQFRDLEGGWLEGAGLAPSCDRLDWLAFAFTWCYPADNPLLLTAPTPEGGIWMEWSQQSNVFILEIDLHTHLGEWLWFDHYSEAEQELGLNLDQAADWEWFAAEIRNKFTGAE